MENLYYKIWVDAINFERKSKEGFRNWKVYTMIGMTMMQYLNFMELTLLLYAFKIKYNVVLIDFLPGSMLDGFLSGSIIAMPFAFINYLLIFRKRRYEILLIKYKNNDGKLYKRYVLLSLVLFILPVYIIKIFDLSL
jgi:hypothetical protein